jgi:hypothetical protein
MTNSCVAAVALALWLPLLCAYPSRCAACMVRQVEAVASLLQRPLPHIYVRNDSCCDDTTPQAHVSVAHRCRRRIPRRRAWRRRTACGRCLTPSTASSSITCWACWAPLTPLTRTSRWVGSRRTRLCRTRGFNSVLAVLALAQLERLRRIVGECMDRLCVGWLPVDTLLLVWDTCVLSSFEGGMPCVIAALLHTCRADLLRCTTVRLCGVSVSCVCCEVLLLPVLWMPPSPWCMCACTGERGCSGVPTAVRRHAAAVAAGATLLVVRSAAAAGTSCVAHALFSRVFCSCCCCCCYRMSVALATLCHCVAGLPEERLMSDPWESDVAAAAPAADDDDAVASPHDAPRSVSVAAGSAVLTMLRHQRRLSSAFGTTLSAANVAACDAHFSNTSRACLCACVCVQRRR